MKRGILVKNSIAFLLAVVSLSCLLVITISVLKLPEAAVGNTDLGFYRSGGIRKITENMKLGEFGEMMIEMLPEDLAFTLFLPSERAFERDLRLRVNESSLAEKVNDTYAVVSRILGFSAVPRSLFSGAVPVGREVMYDSVSGHTLYVSKEESGMLVVNRVRSEKVDLRRGEIVVHVMDGVIMDADFEQAVQPDDVEEA